MIKLPKINLKYVLGVLVKVFGLFRHFVGNQRAKHFQKNRYFAIFQTSNRSRFREAWVEVPKPFRVHPAHIWEQLYRILVILAFIPFLKSVPQCECFFSFFCNYESAADVIGHDVIGQPNLKNESWWAILQGVEIRLELTGLNKK